MSFQDPAIDKLISSEAAEQLVGKIAKLNLEDDDFEKQLTFASAALMLGEQHPGASVAMGVCKSIEDAALFQALALLGQSLPLLKERGPVGEAVSTVISRGLRQCAQILIEKANTLDNEE